MVQGVLGHAGGLLLEGDMRGSACTETRRPQSILIQLSNKAGPPLSCLVRSPYENHLNHSITINSFPNGAAQVIQKENTVVLHIEIYPRCRLFPVACSFPPQQHPAQLNRFFWQHKSPNIHQPKATGLVFFASKHKTANLHLKIKEKTL